MKKMYVQIDTLSDADAKEMFQTLAQDVLGASLDEAKRLIGVPKASQVTIKDLIELIKEMKVSVKIRVDYEISEKVVPPVDSTTTVNVDSVVNQQPIVENNPLEDDLPDL